MRACINRELAAWERRCALTLLGAWLAFLGLFCAAGAIYPGGNWLDRSAHGHVFFANYFCDLTQPVSLSGVDNSLGSRLAQLALLCFAVALAAFFWLIPRYFVGGARATVWVRRLGQCAVLSYAAVPLTPSARFGEVHAWLALLAGALGIAAALCAVWALWRSGRTARGLAGIGASALAAGTLHAVLFVHYMHGSEPAPLIVPAAQKVAALLLSAWMLGLAWLTLFGDVAIRRREIDR